MNEWFLSLNVFLRLAIGFTVTFGVIFLIPLVANRIVNKRWDFCKYVREILSALR